MSDDLRALSDAASPGRWDEEDWPPGDGSEQDRQVYAGTETVAVKVRVTDAAYVVALVNAHRAGQGAEGQDIKTATVAVLLAENARLRAQVAAVEAVLTTNRSGLVDAADVRAALAWEDQ